MNTEKHIASERETILALKLAEVEKERDGFKIWLKELARQFSERIADEKELQQRKLDES